MAGQWVPRDQDELTAGWRLWLELGSCVWPRPDWDGSPAEAVRGVRELMKACDEILAGYLAAGGSQSSEVAALLRSMYLGASWTWKAWQGDTLPLDDERAEMLHRDLAGFADHARGVQTLLARGGGWTSLTL